MKAQLSVMGLLSLAILLTGCDYNRPKPTSQMPDNQSFYIQNKQVMAEGSYPLTAYNKIVFSGPVDVTVKSEQAQNVARVSGEPSATSKVQVIQKGNTLYIGSTANHRSNVEVDMQSSNIPLKLVLLGNSHIEMSGNFLIQKIVAAGRSQLKLTWLNSTYLDVVAKDRAKLFLAGVVTHLDLSAFDGAEVNGKYLKVDDSYIMTTNNASVGVDVKNALGTQSFDNSNIYYYHDPESAGLYLYNNGSALRLKGLSDASNNLLD